MNLRRTLSPLALTAAAASISLAPAAHADAVAFIVNVTMRPGYNFPNADAAIAYGNGICDKIRAGEPFIQLVRETKADFDSSDDWQGIYIIGQAAQELCPGLIWQLRKSAEGFTTAN